MAYKSQVKHFVLPGFVKDQQRAWLASVKDCALASAAGEPSCLAQFLSRIAQLRQYDSAKVYSDYGKKFDHEGMTLLTYQKDGAMWLEWYGAWMPDAYRPKPFPDGFLAQDSGKLTKKGDQFGLEDHDDAKITISEDKIRFGGQYGMSLSARQGPIHGDFARVR